MPAAGAGSFAGRVARQLGLDPSGLTGTGPDGAATLHDVLRQAGREAPAATRPSAAGTVGEAGEEGGGVAKARHRREMVCDAGPLRQACEALAAVSPEPPEVLDVVVRLCGAALRDVPAFHGFPRPGGDGEKEVSGAVALVVAGSRRTAVIPDAAGAGARDVREAVRATGGGMEGRSGRQAGSAGGPGEASAARPGDEAAVRPGPAFVVRTPDAPMPPIFLPGPPAATTGGTSRVVLTVDEVVESIAFALEFEAGTASAEGGEAFLAALRALCLDPRRALL